MSQNCPACGAQLDYHIDTSTGEHMQPSPGDMGVCDFCGEQMIMTEKGLVILTEQIRAGLTFTEREVLGRVSEGWNLKHARGG